MKPLFFITLTVVLLVINNCSDQKSASDSDPKDHVLRQQFDTMNDAKAVTDTINQTTKAQDAQADALAGH